jgi:NhaA family Na+:H+ antiporter
MLSPIKQFLKLEAASGIILIFAATLAMILANTPFNDTYKLLIDMPVEIRFGPLQIAKPLLLWINDGLMAIFFFLIGLELKREILEGNLSNPRNVILPGLGAIGGMAVPALIYIAFNHSDPVALDGWAIPAATDIAFALGILTLLGDRVPTSLKVFLATLAIFDDIGAIVIIALFYSGSLSGTALMIAFTCLCVLFIMNRRHCTSFTPYILVGMVLWIAVLKSGVHATLAGVILAAFIPMRDPQNPTRSPLQELEHDLHSAVAFAILPIFAFVNAGISLEGIGSGAALHPVPLGIILGLFFGKQFGIFSLCWLGIKLGIARLPEKVSWGGLYGAGILCGVGFTMSLFIGSLAFEETGVNLLFNDRLGIILGSLLSGIAGYILLRSTLKRPSNQNN